MRSQIQLLEGLNGKNSENKGKEVDKERILELFQA